MDRKVVESYNRIVILTTLVEGHMRPVPRHLDVAAVDECWKAGGHDNPAEGSRLQGKCLYSRTKFGSTLWGDCAAWHEEIQPLFFFE